jgi:parvulin-like peptidyl-prolyl isomerase
MIDLATRIFPFPAASVDGFHFVSIRDVRDNVSSVRSLYENQDFVSVGIRIDFSTSDGKKRLKIKEKEVINKMIEDSAIEILAKERGIRLTKSMIGENLERKIKEAGGEEGIEGNLEKLYGWDLKDFEEKVVTPGMYKSELKKNVNESDLKGSIDESKEKIEELKKDLDSGKDFASVVNSNSSEESSRNGELGWFKRSYMTSSLEGTVFDIDIIESELGFHIVKILDKKIEDNEELIEISQIFVAKRTFGEWLEEEMKEMSIKVYIKDYEWNNDEVICDFKDESMRAFESVLVN